MEFTLFDLITAFGFSLLFGLILAVVYEPFRIFHKIGFSKPIHYFVSDFFYMIIFAVLTYFFCLVLLEGSVRLFVIIGEILGFTLFYIIVRPVLDRIYNPIIKISKKFAFRLLKITRKVMYNVYSISGNMYRLVKSKVMNNVWKKEKGSRYQGGTREHKRSKNKKEKA